MLIIGQMECMFIHARHIHPLDLGQMDMGTLQLVEAMLVVLQGLIVKPQHPLVTSVPNQLRV